MLSIRNEMTRILLIKMGKLCEEYKEPYDDMDREADKHNAPLEIKFQIYKELLEELSK